MHKAQSTRWAVVLPSYILWYPMILLEDSEDPDQFLYGTAYVDP